MVPASWVSTSTIADYMIVHPIEVFFHNTKVLIAAFFEDYSLENCSLEKCFLPSLLMSCVILSMKSLVWLNTVAYFITLEM